MQKRTSKYQLSDIVLGSILSCVAERSLSYKYSLTPLEQSTLVLIKYLQEKGYSVYTEMLDEYSLANKRNIYKAVQKLVTEGYIYKVEAKGKINKNLIITDTGLEFLSNHERVLRLKVKSLRNS